MNDNSVPPSPLRTPDSSLSHHQSLGRHPDLSLPVNHRLTHAPIPHSHRQNGQNMNFNLAFYDDPPHPEHPAHQQSSHSSMQYYPSNVPRHSPPSHPETSTSVRIQQRSSDPQHFADTFDSSDDDGERETQSSGSLHRQAADISAGPPHRPRTPEFSPEVYTDRMSNAFHLSPDSRRQMHFFRRLVTGVEVAHLRAYIFQQASIFHSLERQHRSDVAQAQTQAALEEVKSSIQKEWRVDESLKKEIRAICKRIGFDPKRLDMHFVEDVMAEIQKLSKEKDSIWKVAFKSTKNTDHLRSVVGGQVSYIKDCLRTFLRNTTFGVEGLDKMSLSEGTYQAVRDFLGFGANANAQHVLWMAILRDHTRKCEDILISTASRQSTILTPGGEPPQKRRKAGGRPPRDEDFWGRLMTFVSVKPGWGPDIHGNANWQRYIDDLIKEERKAFPEDAISLIPSTRGQLPVPSHTPTAPSHDGDQTSVLPNDTHSRSHSSTSMPNMVPFSSTAPEYSSTASGSGMDGYGLPSASEMESMVADFGGRS